MKTLCELTSPNRLEINPTEEVSSFLSPLASAASGRSGAPLDLIYQAADVVRDVEEHAIETQKYALIVAKKLEIAERRIQALEAKQRAAQAYIDEAHVKIQQERAALKLERSRVEAAKNRLHQQPRARTTNPRTSAGAEIFARRYKKIAEMIAYVESKVLCLTARSDNSDAGHRDLGWTEILARADAALNDAQGSHNRYVYHKRHSTLRQVA